MTALPGLPTRRAVTAVAQVAFPHQANGSLISVNGQVVGSSLIGQALRRTRNTSRAGCRPRARTGTTPSSSAGSNLGPTNQDLIDRVRPSVDAFRAANGDAPIPVDLVTTSASGLDPDISPAGAEYQVARVAKARGMTEDDVRAAVARHTEEPTARVPRRATGQRARAEPRPGRPPAMTDRDRREAGRDERPTAEEMLARTRHLRRGERGRLRVYLGMAPGVGKTFRMLEEAHRRTGRGQISWSASSRPTAGPRPRELLDGLEIVPRRRLDYRGVDGRGDGHRRRPRPTTERRPRRRAGPHQRSRLGAEKRWEDVEILLAAGIDVVSTCNIQHLESVADAVATITGAPVNERIPDEVLSRPTRSSWST